MLALICLFGASKGFAAERWLAVEIGIIGTASDGILKSAMKQVKDDGFQGLVIQLDTPGGSLDATRAMVKDILGSEFPVFVWVGPAGARAGSAGAFVTLAGHLAYMAPGTNIGAAHPVSASGEEMDETMKQKVENDTVAFMESIAQTRGRNVDMAVSFVLSSLSLTAEKAKEEKVIDDLASNLNQVFELSDGKEVKLGDETKTLQTRGATWAVYQKTIQQKFLEILSNPNLFYLLFVAGLIGIAFELTHPGVMIPGVLGAISLILALIATATLPVSFGAMILMVASAAFIVAEIFVPSFGILGIGGIVGFVIGSILLVDPSNELGLRVSYYAIGPAVIALLLLGLLVSFLVVKAKKSKIMSGKEGMVGMSGSVLGDFSKGQGRVMVGGENWFASSLDGQNFLKGDKVQVREVKGLQLIIEKQQ
jgi:membrane-bound serine protease (ClpP class)